MELPLALDSALVPILIGLVALLLIASGVVLWLRRRQTSTPAARHERPRDDLHSLGIVDIRPAPKAASRPADEHAARAKPAEPAGPEAAAAAPDPTTPPNSEGAASIPAAQSADEPGPAAVGEEPAEATASDATRRTLSADLGVAGPEATPAEAGPEPAPALHESAYYEFDDPEDGTIRVADPSDASDDLDFPMPLPDEASESQPPSRALAYLIESVGAALGAQTVALLRHEASTLSYIVEALVSEHQDVVETRAFPSAGSALRALRGTEPHLLKGASLDALGYYAHTGGIGRAYVQLLTQAAPPALLLVVDTSPEAPSFSAAQKRLLQQYASLLAHLAQQERPAWFIGTSPMKAHFGLSAEAVGAKATGAEADGSSAAGAVSEAGSRAEAPAPEAPAAEAPAAEEPDAPGAQEPGAEAGSEEAQPVARRVIVAEEMERARAEQRPLALALVHHADAEALAQRGPEPVAEAESRLRRHLEYSLALADGRIERFGELLFGVFYYGRAADVEAWVELVRTTPAPSGETLPVAIGVALLRDRHATSEEFRTDAVQALTEAYEAQVGCVILE